MIRLVTFDLDGTTADTIRTIGNCVNMTLRHFDLPQIPESDYPLYVGGGGREMFRRVCVHFSLSEDNIPPMFAYFKDLYAAEYLNGTVAFPGIPELLRELRKRGIHVAVLTNKIQKISEDIVSHLFGDTVEAVIGDAPGVRLKPDPYGLLELMRRFGVPAEECLHVGDCDTDILAARAAGCPVAAVSWGYSAIDKLMALEPDARIDRPEEILSLTERL